MNEILIPALAIGAVGLVLGALLAIASKLFAVEVDERTIEITQVLPGANCGSCGYAGCSAYADAVSKGEAKINCCSPGGQITADNIATIMGVSSEAVEEKKAVILCNGTNETAFDKYDYTGEMDCIAASKLQGGGHKACTYGCLGYGSCARVCKNGAISIENGIAVVDTAKCGGCGECEAICPKNIIKIVPKKNNIVVKCKSCDKGQLMKEKCSAGCIGCKICEKNCPEGAITVTDNCASIDYSKCSQCGLCVERCPKKIIEFEGNICIEESLS